MSSGTADTIWTYWCNNNTHTSTASITGDRIWLSWASTSTNSTTQVVVNAAPPERTPEQIAAERERLYRAQQRAQEIAAEEQRKREVAEAVSEKLLHELLTEEQRATYKRERYIIVIGRSGKRYRVRRGRSGNVDVVNREGYIESRLCVHPGVWCPDPDTMVAQLLHLQENDEEFCRLANHHPLPNYLVGQQVLPAVH